MTWRIGKLELIGGATAYWSETFAATFPDSERSHRYYYVRARRRLF